MSWEQLLHLASGFSLAVAAFLVVLRWLLTIVED